MNKLIKTLKHYFKRHTKDKSCDSNMKPMETKLNLYEQWELSRKYFMHYAIRFMYDYGDNYRNVVTEDERNYCRGMANYWDKQMSKLRKEIRM